jgi:hypothetical protein
LIFLSAIAASTFAASATADESATADVRMVRVVRGLKNLSHPLPFSRIGESFGLTGCPGLKPCAAGTYADQNFDLPSLGSSGGQGRINKISPRRSEASADAAEFRSGRRSADQPAKPRRFSGLSSCLHFAYLLVGRRGGARQTKY